MITRYLSHQLTQGLKQIVWVLKAIFKPILRIITASTLAPVMLYLGFLLVALLNEVDITPYLNIPKTKFDLIMVLWMYLSILIFIFQIIATRWEQIIDNYDKSSKRGVNRE